MNPKHKGNTNERWAAQKLSDWWGSVFKRIPSSGALRWHGETDVYGDLLVPEDFPGIVECKHNKKFDLLALLSCKPNKDNILGWWEQVTSDVARAAQEQGYPRQPILIAKGNRTTPIIAVSNQFAQNLPKIRHIQYSEGFSIYELTVFLSSVNKAEFKDAHRGVYGNGTTKKSNRRRSGGTGTPLRPNEGLGRLPKESGGTEGLPGAPIEGAS